MLNVDKIDLHFSAILVIDNKHFELMLLPVSSSEISSSYSQTDKTEITSSRRFISRLETLPESALLAKDKDFEDLEEIKDATDSA